MRSEMNAIALAAAVAATAAVSTAGDVAIIIFDNIRACLISESVYIQNI